MFRSEVKHHPASGRLPPVKLPGKENKGNMYDPSPMRNHKNDQRLPFHINSPKNVEKGNSKMIFYFSENSKPRLYLILLTKDKN